LDSFFDQRMVRPKKFLDLKENQKVQVVLDWNFTAFLGEIIFSKSQQ
jgi:hypothetical protein